MATRDPVRDVVRGLTSLEMTFVNISGLAWTSHAPYIGRVRYADTIFPCFAFLAGMAPTPPRRSLGLIGLGVALNALGAATADPPRKTRLPGVLQRLGLASLLANAPALEILQRGYGALLVAVWYAVSLLGATNAENPLANPEIPGADAAGTAQTRLDALVFGDRLYRADYDPEGLLGALTTAVSMLAGGYFRDAAGLDGAQKAAAALGLVVAGEVLHVAAPRYAPVSKSLWTPSFVLVSTGTSVLKYLAVERAVPYLPTAVQELLLAVGKRSLEVYVISTVLTLVYRLGGPQSVMERGKRFFGSFSNAAVADFVMSLSLTGLTAASANFLVAHNLRLRW